MQGFTNSGGPVSQLAFAIDKKPMPQTGGYLVRCPCHDDKTASLSLRYGTHGILVHCFAGCPREQVVAELRSQGLWPVRSRNSNAASGNNRGGVQILSSFINIDGLLYLRRRPFSMTTRMVLPNQTLKNLSFGPDNYRAMEQHLGALAGQADIENLRFIFTAFPDQGTGKPWQCYGTLRDVLSDIVRLQNAGYGIFVTVNGSRNDRRTKADINCVRAVWGDFDQPMVGTFALSPSLKIQTGPRKGHAYWMIDQADLPTPHEAEQINRQIAAMHGADPNACDRSRVLRLPGTYHLKREPYLARIVDANGALYSRSQLLAAYPLPPPEPVKPVDISDIKHADRYVQAGINGEARRMASAVEGTRNSTLNNCAVSLARLGLSLGQVAAVLGPVAVAVGLSKREAWVTIQSGHGYGSKQPRRQGAIA